MVIMDRVQYLLKAKETLEDKSLHPVNTNRIQKLDNWINRTLSGLSKKGQITKEEQ